MTEQLLERRAFLAKALTYGLAVAGFSSLVAACDKKAPLQCIDASGLSEQERAVRQALAYIDQTPQRDQACASCSQYQPPAEAGTCGSCQIVPGPINPAGRCDSWTARES